MSKIKLLTTTIIVLILINIATLTFFFFKAPRPPMDKKNPKEIVIEKLHFDENQVASYNELIKTHSEKIKHLNEVVLETKNTLFLELSEPSNTTKTDNLFLQLASQLNEIEKTHYNHFLAIKKMCKPEQINDYNALTKELSKIFSPKLPPNERNREQRP